MTPISILGDVITAKYKKRYVVKSMMLKKDMAHIILSKSFVLRNGHHFSVSLVENEGKTVIMVIFNDFSVPSSFVIPLEHREEYLDAPSYHQYVVAQIDGVICKCDGTFHVVERAFERTRDGVPGLV
jgi:hypothetical protein